MKTPYTNKIKSFTHQRITYPILLFLIISQMLCVMKNDCTGQQSITWQRLYNGPQGLDDTFWDICQSSDGYYYVVGTTNPLGGYILKLDDYGDTIWSKIISGIEIYAVVTTNDGGCVITGSSDSAFTSKINASGQIVWFKKYPSGKGEDIVKTTDCGYLVCGYAGFNGTVYKVDSLGNALWFKTFTSGFFPRFSSVIEAYNGGYILAGSTSGSYTDTIRIFIVKINNNGDTIWTKKYKFGDGAGASSIEKVNNTYIIGGTVAYYGETTTDTFRILLLRTDLDGNLIYSKIFKFDNTSLIREDLFDLKPINPNKYIICASRDSDIVIPTINKAIPIIIDSLGNILYMNFFSHGDYENFKSVIPLNNGDLIFAGILEFPNAPFSDGYVVRTDSTLYASPMIGIKIINEKKPSEFKLYQNYPNPFNNTTIIRFDLNRTDAFVKLAVYDILGRQVTLLVNQKLKASSYEISWNAYNYSSGVYYYTIQTDNKRFSLPMILIK